MSVLGVHWKDWCWSWNSNTLATSCTELIHWKRRWCWEGLGVGGKGDDRGWDGWMVSLTWSTWVWMNFGCERWTGRPGVLYFMGSQRVRHTERLNWTELISSTFFDSLQVLPGINWHMHEDVVHTCNGIFSSVQFSRSVCPTLCDPMNRSTPGLPVHHQLPEFTQTHIHQVSDAIQPSHPLLSPSSLAPNPSQHQIHYIPNMPHFT